MPVVSLVLQEVPSYRERFLDRLYAQLRTVQVDLNVMYGRSTGAESSSFDRVWAQQVETVAGRLFNLDYVWQPVLQNLANSDLVIVEQANRHLINYLLHARRILGKQKLAYWGHGRNLQSTAPRGVRERLKLALLDQVDWWFAYTDTTKEYLESRRYPSECITVVNNSLDDESLARGLAACAAEGRLAVRNRLNCGHGPIALYSGRLSNIKRIDFLLAAGESIRARLPDFELLIVGDGPDRAQVEQAAKINSWIHYFGSITDQSRAQFWFAADVALMPGAAGLVIVDSFVAGCPLVTTRHSMHGPEYAYLAQGTNAVVTDGDVDAYAVDVIGLLSDRERLKRMQAACRESAQKYSLESMTSNFVRGTLDCLNLNGGTRTGLAHS